MVAVLAILADEEVSAGPHLQHQRKIFRSHYRARMSNNTVSACNARCAFEHTIDTMRMIDRRRNELFDGAVDLNAIGQFDTAGGSIDLRDHAIPHIR